MRSEIATLSADQKKIIRVGMSAKVEIRLTPSQSLLIPIKAVFKQNGKTMVKVLNKGKATDVEVTTGQTTLNQVEITKGLKPDDQVVLP